MPISISNFDFIVKCDFRNSHSVPKFGSCHFTASAPLSKNNNLELIPFIYLFLNFFPGFFRISRIKHPSSNFETRFHDLYGITLKTGSKFSVVFLESFFLLFSLEMLELGQIFFPQISKTGVLSFGLNDFRYLSLLTENSLCQFTFKIGCSINIDVINLKDKSKYSRIFFSAFFPKFSNEIIKKNF